MKNFDQTFDQTTDLFQKGFALGPVGILLEVGVPALDEVRIVPPEGDDAAIVVDKTVTRPRFGTELAKRWALGYLFSPPFNRLQIESSGIESAKIFWFSHWNGLNL